jgi:predicted transposase/invertase (TIGR01784 family)
MKFVNPKNDVAFKKIFGNQKKKEILISFLNAVLGRSGEKEIIDLRILNPYLTPKLSRFKTTLLDIRAKDKHGTTFIIEMQVEKVAHVRKRFTYYVAKTYASQLERGNHYPKLKPVIFIGILDFKEFDSKHYLTHHLILNTENQKQDIPDCEFHFLELPKFTRTVEQLETPLEKWIYFIKNAEDLDVIPDHVDDPVLHTAYEIANRFRWSTGELEEYEYWGMKAQDALGAIEVAVEEGLQQGLQQGQEKGEQQKAKAIAVSMLAKGLDLALIVEMTGLTLEEITVLSNK